MGRLVLCTIAFSIVAICLQTAYAEADTSAVFSKIEEAYLKEVVAGQTNYFVPKPIQTSGGDPGKFDYLSNELIVLYDSEKGGHSPADIVDAANGRKSFPGLINQLEDPIRGRFLIPFRLSQSDLERRGKEHPRVILQNYVVLEYPSVISQEGMYNLAERLAKNPLIRWVENNNYLEWSVVSTDPLFLGAINPPTYTSHQWGMEMLNLPPAWAYVKGSAYIAALDNEIEEAHPDL